MEAVKNVSKANEKKTLKHFLRSRSNVNIFMLNDRKKESFQRKIT